ncbi:helix-turn-helix transcriptional regulator [Streptomyces odontomachi]|uniref:helix-turn-helix transcriptional regulator n=1 Tax=Streptomyces odontomachi TaxID=2944940 RepID=UPI00210C1B87|nr:AAA family ATPase [Streptomyces sp. ODS25]
MLEHVKNRKRELAETEEMLRASMLGRCRVALASGAVGSGKTELLHAFTERAMELGATVLTVPASPTERNTPAAVLRQLLSSIEAAGEDTGALRDLLEQCGSKAAGTAPDTSTTTSAARSTTAPQAVPAAFLDGLYHALARLSAARPLVIAIDDVQYADGVSLSCLRSLMQQLRFARVLFVLTESEHDQWRNPLFRVELLRQPGFCRIRLAPMPPEEIRSMLSQSLGPRLAAAWSDECRAVSGGNPLLVRALLDDCEMATAVTGLPRPRGGLPVGDSFGQAVLACLYRGNSTMLAVARALALLDTDGSVDLVTRLLGLEPAEVDQAMRGLAHAGVVEDGRLRHERARAAIVEDLPAQQRTALHLAALRLLYEIGAPATSVARHLVAARHTDDPWVVDVLRAAAEQELRSQRPEQAISFLELAESAASSEDDRLEIAMMLLRAEWRVNPALSADRLTQLITALQDGRLGRIHTGLLVYSVLVYSLLWHGRTDDVATVLSLLGKSAEQCPQSAMELHALVRWLRTSYPAALDQWLSPSTSDPGTRSLFSARPRSAGLLSILLSEGGDADAAGAAERMLHQLEPDEGTIAPVESALYTLIYAGHPDRTAAWCDRLLDGAKVQQAPVWSAMVSAARAEAAIRLGDLVSAEFHGTAALDRLPPRGWGTAVGAPMAPLMLAKSAMGKHEDAAALLGHLLPGGAMETRYGLHYLYARGHHYLMTKKLQAALADFLMCGELMDRWSIDLPSIVPWRSAAAATLVHLGEPERARGLAEEQLVKPCAGQSRCRGISLRVLARVSERRHRASMLREAVTHLRGSGDQLELAHALAELGFAHAALGEDEHARGVFRQALRLADECRAEPLRKTLLSRLPDSLPATPVARATPHDDIIALSEAEERVATLASLGFTNREIAGKLYITISTVEQHLTRVYRKLRVRSRTELQATLRKNPARAAS